MSNDANSSPDSTGPEKWIPGAGLLAIRLSLEEVSEVYSSFLCEPVAEDSQAVQDLKTAIQRGVLFCDVFDQGLNAVTTLGFAVGRFFDALVRMFDEPFASLGSQVLLEPLIRATLRLDWLVSAHDFDTRLSRILSEAHRDAAEEVRVRKQQVVTTDSPEAIADYNATTRMQNLEFFASIQGLPLGADIMPDDFLRQAVEAWAFNGGGYQLAGASAIACSNVYVTDWWLTRPEIAIPDDPENRTLIGRVEDHRSVFITAYLALQCIGLAADDLGRFLGRSSSAEVLDIATESRKLLSLIMNDVEAQAQRN